MKTSKMNPLKLTLAQLKSALKTTDQLIDYKNQRIMQLQKEINSNLDELKELSEDRKELTSEIRNRARDK